MVHVEAPPREENGDPAIVIFLGLYLLLLAFFILLNSISRFEEEKTRKALGSLTSTFSNVQTPDSGADWLNSLEGNFLSPEAFQDRISMLVKTAFPIARVEKVQPLRRMQVTIPQESLFVPGQARFRRSALTLIDGIANALGRNPPGMRYEAEIVLGGPWITPKALAKGQTLTIARSGAFARELDGRGAPRRSIAVGLDHGTGDMVRMMFRIDPDDAPKIDFDETVE